VSSNILYARMGQDRRVFGCMLMCLCCAGREDCLLVCVLCEGDGDGPVRGRIVSTNVACRLMPKLVRRYLGTFVFYTFEHTFNIDGKDREL
jgi:hypothetical protein